MTTTDLYTLFLAEGLPGPEHGKGSPWGVVVMLVLVIAVAILGWSMQKHLKKLPKSFTHEEVSVPVETTEKS